MKVAIGRLMLKALLISVVFAVTGTGQLTLAQNNYAIWGEIKIKGEGSDTPSGVTVLLYRDGGSESGRVSVSNRGRYRFTNLGAGDYDVVIEVNDKEIARQRVNILPNVLAPFYGFRQDFEFEWKGAATSTRPAVVSAADAYPRSSANQSLFQKAEQAAGKKKYDEAARFLNAILENDKADFQVWALLGTVYFVQEKLEDAEKAYVKALELKPALASASLNLGRLRISQKRFEEAIDPLTKALEGQPQSAEINLLLGESYLQLKKGSKAVPYLTEAARLGKPEAHLRLAWLYNAAGMKDKAATEYEEFLKKKPDYNDRKKLEDYISANKKS